MFVSLMFLTWASPSTILGLSEMVDPIFNRLSIEKWQHVVRSLREIAPSVRKNAREGLLSLDVTELPENLSDRTFTVMGIRAKQEQAEYLFLKYLSNYQGSDPTIFDFCQETAINLAKTKPAYWQQALTIIAKNYAKGNMVDARVLHSLILDVDHNILPIEIAKQITDYPQKYPWQFVSLAAAKYREVVATKIIPVGEIARRDEWFTQE